MFALFSEYVRVRHYYQDRRFNLVSDPPNEQNADSKVSKVHRRRMGEAMLRSDDLEKGIGGRAARGGLIVLGAQAYRVISQIFFTAILARLLGPEDFGLIAMAMTITAFVGMFTDLGLSSATVQRRSLDQDTVSGLMIVSVAMALLVMFCAFALAPFAASIFEDDRVFWIIIVSSASVPIGADAHTVLGVAESGGPGEPRCSGCNRWCARTQGRCRRGGARSWHRRPALGRIVSACPRGNGSAPDDR